MHSKRKAQLSLEFLLVMAAFILALSVFAPLAVKTTKIALFALEVQRARSFLSDYSNAAFYADIYADGTTKQIRSSTVNEWLLKVENGNAELTLSSESLEKTVVLNSKIPFTVAPSNHSLNDSFTLRLEKESGKISTNLIDANQHAH